MGLQTLLPGKLLGTVAAAERTIAGMSPQVPRQVGPLDEGHGTEVAFVSTLTNV